MNERESSYLVSNSVSQKQTYVQKRFKNLLTVVKNVSTNCKFTMYTNKYRSASDPLMADRITVNKGLER